MASTSVPSSATSRGPDEATGWSNAPPATVRTSAASRDSGAMTTLRRTSAAASTATRMRTPTATKITSTRSAERSRSLRARSRACRRSACVAAIPARSASKRTLPSAGSGTVSPSRTAAITRSAYSRRHAWASSRVRAASSRARSSRSKPPTASSTASASAASRIPWRYGRRNASSRESAKPRIPVSWSSIAFDSRSTARFAGSMRSASRSRRSVSDSSESTPATSPSAATASSAPTTSANHCVTVKRPLLTVRAAPRAAGRRRRRAAPR